MRMRTEMSRRVRERRRWRSDVAMDGVRRCFYVGPVNNSSPWDESYFLRSDQDHLCQLRQQYFSSLMFILHSIAMAARFLSGGVLEGRHCIHLGRILLPTFV